MAFVSISCILGIEYCFGFRISCLEFESVGSQEETIDPHLDRRARSLDKEQKAVGSS